MADTKEEKMVTALPACTGSLMKNDSYKRYVVVIAIGFIGCHAVLAYLMNNDRGAMTELNVNSRLLTTSRR